MISIKKIISLSALLFCCIQFSAAQQPLQLQVQPGKPIAPIQPTMWGIFFEDINFAADGGLYAELVKNRSFEFPMPMMGWDDEEQKGGTSTTLIINNAKTNTGNQRYASVKVNPQSGVYQLINEGFRGMGFQANTSYTFSMWMQNTTGAAVKITVQLVNATGKVIGVTSVPVLKGAWKKISTVINTTDSAQKGKLKLLFEGNGTIDIDMVSLFPFHTFKDRPNGLRADLAQKLADLKPGFVRFPGGCIVEGRDLTNRYQWKATVGNVEDRKLIMNRWNVEFKNKLTPDYYQSFGLGFYEYFQLAEDIGAAPLLILNCGMACQYNSGEVVAMDELQPYIQDALDLIEFANGDSTTVWGKLRTDMGHPAPFHLQFIGVGNEQWEAQYFERYKVFEKAILTKYPGIKIVSGAGPYSRGDYFDMAWKELKQLHPALIDEHYYMPPKWFLDNANRYDNYDRNSIKVFAGEYAAHSKDNAAPEGRNNWESALAEAAFMTGLERNAAVVQMASYAPLLAHVEAWQWRPDLIWFDNTRSAATPNYYVQKLFSNNKGTDVVPILYNNAPLIGKDSVYATAATDQKTNELIIKLVNVSSKEIPVMVNLDKTNLPKQQAALWILQADKYAFNTLDKEVVAPQAKTLDVKGSRIEVTLGAASFTVIRVSTKK
ncbi:MAG: carbohydrate binding domain-containing protein [Bacteroidetes bacterium]|nr:carbohydrate binding domain-containing protein [Bacteroidota bacterium]